MANRKLSSLSIVVSVVLSVALWWLLAGPLFGFESIRVTGWFQWLIILLTVAFEVLGISASVEYFAARRQEALLSGQKQVALRLLFQSLYNGLFKRLKFGTLRSAETENSADVLELLGQIAGQTGSEIRIATERLEQRVVNASALIDKTLVTELYEIVWAATDLASEINQFETARSNIKLVMDSLDQSDPQVKKAADAAYQGFHAAYAGKAPEWDKQREELADRVLRFIEARLLPLADDSLKKEIAGALNKEKKWPKMVAALASGLNKPQERKARKAGEAKESAGS